MTDNPHRLPATAIPHRYDLELRPDLDAATFAGEVHIEVDVLTATTRLVLHAVDLEIDSAWISSGGERLDTTHEFDTDLERVTLTTDRMLEPGASTLTMRFRGVLNDQLLGFYRSTFTSTDEATGE